jgi:hypothetical protein
MRKKWLWLLAPPAIALFIFIGGEIVMHLWNWLLPPLFGWRLITFWQALGLLVLSRILFGGWGGGGSDRGKSRRRDREAWKAMTPEQREEFRQGMRSRFCGADAPRGESKEPA